ncbi:FUSC family protein [Nonomuraea cavernae]|uniref:FUSC family protein n=1 Tax=Nonomuraea cavernae TaxID=2045107 RepID=A0A918DEE3_9ACTN|nr:FUSC family protein [Nonomuraea cavernae]MCA2183732.1 aromatic acid exporter family protein [Nonomuraea cavernae]GGO61195.1 hypothetical protein GCM10012289_02850 [Nonomuraea cavernae]
MSSRWLGNLRQTVRHELGYIRTQLRGLGRPGSQQRLQVRQVAKATLAAVTAWFLADRLLPRESIWFAPATAVIMVHATVYQTLTNGLRRVSAVAAGVILAGSIGHLLGLSALSLVLVIPPALVAARWHRMGRHGTDVATTAVLMLSFGAASQERYLLAYIIATALGALCGAVVNTVLWPPLYRERPDLAFRRLAKHQSDLLSDMAESLRHGWDLSGAPDWERQAARLDSRLAEARTAVADSAESRRYNLRHYQLRRLRRQADRDHAALLRTMTGVGVHLHAIVHALTHLDPTGTSQPDPSDLSDAYARDYADLLDLLADLLTSQIRHADDPERVRELLSRADRQATRIHERMTSEIQAGEVDHPAGWAISGSLLTDAHRIMTLIAGEPEAAPGL